ncbi:MAG: DUF2079 domain-containing protein [Flavobacteriales bacterium]|nr:DUF2079 domain-containing protein [Flavobacteriales bacterium]
MWKRTVARSMGSAEYRWPIRVLGLFALIYALVFVPNHLLFRTYALDLGLYTHAAVTYAHGHLADCRLFLGSGQPLLADHFDLHLMLWAPLTWLFGQWTLLLVQWVAVLAGGWGMWRWLRELGASPSTATWGLAHFLAFFGIYGAFTFDFHSNVVATMAFPWYGLALAKQRKAWAWLLLLFMLSAKENMGIWLCFVAIGFLVHQGKDKAMRWMLAAQAFTALAWSTVVIGLVMPALAGGVPYVGWKYPALGSGPLDAVRILALHPAQVFQGLLDGGDVPEGHAIKQEMLMLLCIAGGWALLLRPWILLMAVPLLLQKLLHAGPAQWGVLGHYSVEFAPLCTMAVFTWPPVRMGTRAGKVLAVLATVGSIAVAVHVMDASIYKENRARQRVYQADHYSRDYDVPAVRRLLRGIPSGAAVSASAAFVPHLVSHRDLYLYPVLDHAQVIVLATKEEPYPLSRDEFAASQDTLRRSVHWAEAEQCDGAVMYTRKTP